MAIALFYSSYRYIYGKLIDDLDNYFTLATNRYPNTFKYMHNLASNLKHNSQYILQSLGPNSDGLDFSQEFNIKEVDGHIPDVL